MSENTNNKSLVDELSDIPQIRALDTVTQVRRAGYPTPLWINARMSR
jgi:hypothetical protein